MQENRPFVLSTIWYLPSLQEECVIEYTYDMILYVDYELYVQYIHTYTLPQKG